MITSIHRPIASLRCLLADEADFIDAAFGCVLPKARDEGLQVSASAYVDAKLAALPARGSADNIDFYRAGIAEVQVLNDAAEAYFDVVDSPWAQAHEALRAAAS
jgi:hypothetical protein